MASIFIQYFTVPGASALDELDGTLAQDARDLKYVVFNSKETMDELKNLVSHQLAAQSQSAVMDRAGINVFKTLIRNILVIGSGLVHTKELRDIFLFLQGMLELRNRDRKDCGTMRVARLVRFRHGHLFYDTCKPVS